MIIKTYKQESDKYQLAILIKENALNNENEIFKYYIKPIQDLYKDNILIVGLPYNSKGKITVAFAKEYLTKCLEYLEEYNIKHLLVADSVYFKTLTKVGKTEPYLGYIVDCKYEGYKNLKAILTLNYSSLFYKPDNISKIDLSIQILRNLYASCIKKLGEDIIHSSDYPSSNKDIEKTLYKLLSYDALACDTENFGLSLDTADIASIGFAWDQHNGVSFLVNEHSKKLLKGFFTKYEGTLIFHNASYDIRNIIYRLFMNDYLDNVGLIHGLNIMYKSVHDTMVIKYLATNSTAKNELGLKASSHEFAGNYAQENINDVRKIPKDELLKYNLTDCLCTWYVFNKYYQKMIKDNQLDIYNNLFIPSLKVVTHMELSGMPMDMDQVNEVYTKLNHIRESNTKSLKHQSSIKDMIWNMKKEQMIKDNQKLKKKVRSISDIDINFNPNSPIQLSKLIYEYLDLPIIERTETGLPSTGNSVLQELLDQILKENDLTIEDL